MVANRKTNSAQTLNHGVVQSHVSIPIATGTPGTISGKHTVASAARTGAGVIKLTLADSHRKMLYCNPSLVQDGAGIVTAYVTDDQSAASTPYVEVTTTVSGAAADLVTGTLMCAFAWAESSADR